jgi:hypothetical protein
MSRLLYCIFSPELKVMGAEGRPQLSWLIKALLQNYQRHTPVCCFETSKSRILGQQQATGKLKISSLSCFLFRTYNCDPAQEFLRVFKIFSKQKFMKKWNFQLKNSASTLKRKGDTF